VNRREQIQLLRRYAASVLLLLLLGPNVFLAQNDADKLKPQLRARGLGIPFDGTPEPFNAITDVQGVEVGYKTLITGEGILVAGNGPVRTE
jgi:hypothetical protein